jgi:hypothetical protein
MRERNLPWAMLGKVNSPPHQVERGVRPECEGEDLLTTTYFSEQNELLSIDLSILVEVVIIMLLVIKSYLKYIFTESVGPTAKGLREDAGNISALPGRRPIHKRFGSDYSADVIPVMTKHYAMLQRNLTYTSITRGKRLVVLVGQKKAVAIAVKNVSGRTRWSKLDEWFQAICQRAGCDRGSVTPTGEL